MKIKAVYNITYKITDFDLYQELESNNSKFVEFLTSILDSIRYSEDFTKNMISTESDELFWDDELGVGEVQVLVTIEANFMDDLEYCDNLLKDIKEIWNTPMSVNAKTFSVDDYATLISKGGAFWSIVNWGSTIKVDEESDGCLFEFNEDLRDIYIDRIKNTDNGIVLVNGEFTDIKGNSYELYDWVETKEEVLNSIEKSN